MTKIKLVENQKFSQCENGGHTVKGRKIEKFRLMTKKGHHTFFVVNWVLRGRLIYFWNGPLKFNPVLTSDCGLRKGLLANRRNRSHSSCPFLYPADVHRRPTNSSDQVKHLRARHRNIFATVRHTNLYDSLTIILHVFCSLCKPSYVTTCMQFKIF